MGKQNNTVKFGVPGFFGVAVCAGVFRCSGVPGCSGVLVLVHAEANGTFVTKFNSGFCSMKELGVLLFAVYTLEWHASPSQVTASILQGCLNNFYYPYILLSGEKHREINAPCSLTQHTDLMITLETQYSRP